MILFFTPPPEPQTTRKQSITEQKRRDNAASIYVPFPHKRKKEAEKTFCAGHESAEKWIHVDIFHSGTRYPECASSIHTTFPQDPVGACQQILCFYIYSIQAVWLGHEARLLQSDRDFWRGAVMQHRVYCFISLNASCNLRLRWCQSILQEKEVTHGRKLWIKFAISVTNYLTLTVVNGVWVPFNLHTIKAYLTATNSHWKSITTSPLGVRYRRDSQPCRAWPQCLEQTNSRHFKGKGLF